MAKEKKDISTKKKAKDISATPTTGSTVDAYKDVIEFEEQEAIKRNPDEDLNLFCEATELFKKLMREINELKIADTPQAKGKILELQKEVCLLFGVFKKLNRLEKFRTNQNREMLHKAKQKTDSDHLQLQNLLYETLHLRKEVRKCQQFTSKDKFIDLVSIEEFYKDAPESISRQEVTKADAHQLQLARLEWELKQRKQKALLYNEMQTNKENTAAENHTKQAQLDNLAPMLKDILNVAKPVQELLGMTTGPSPEQQKMAYLLPPPLYFLFVQADALREAGDKNITVKIEGDEEEVQRMKQTINEDACLEDSDSDTQEEVVNKRHGHRKKSQADRQEERRRLLLTAHPLTVILNINLRDNVGSISLQFSYLVKLHVVTVRPHVNLSPAVTFSSVSSVNKLLDGEQVLTELFPEDFGDGSPNTANIYQLKQLGIEQFNSSKLGLAYVWAQRMAGLNFAWGGGREQDVPARQQVSQNTLPAVVKAIRRRVSGRVALCTQIQTLETSSLPGLAEVRKCFPARLACELQQWTALTWVGYQALGFTQPLVNHGFVSERDMLYKATLSRGTARCTVAVAIKNSYPLLPPVFALEATFDDKTIRASDNDSIRDMEREVNVYFKELLEKTRSSAGLLTAQLLKVMTDFDILVEASPSPEYPREKIFVQATRGRNRAWPFKQVEIGDGIFHYFQR